MIAKSLSILLLATALQTPAKDVSSPYTRSLTSPDGKVRMETSIQQLTSPGKPDIWLVGAIHIGAREYYSNLQKVLDQSSLVLYEGVKSEKAVVPAAETNPPVGEKPKAIYKALSDAFGLEFQLTAIDYTKKNWKNCDLTWEAMDKLNGSTGAAGGAKTSGNYGLIKQLMDPNSPTTKNFVNMLETATPGTKEALKLVIVKQVASGEVSLDAATEKLVIEARNKVVMDTLGTTIQAKDAPASIAVFYGARHLPSMEKDLIKQYGYKLGKQQWVQAADADPKKVDATGQMILDMFEKRGKGG